MSRGPNELGPKWVGAQMSQGPNELGPKCVGAQMSRGPNESGPKWVGAQMCWGPNESGAQMSGAQMSQGPKWGMGPNVSQPFKFRLQKRYFCQMFSCYQTVICNILLTFLVRSSNFYGKSQIIHNLPYWSSSNYDWNRRTRDFYVKSHVIHSLP